MAEGANLLALCEQLVDRPRGLLGPAARSYLADLSALLPLSIGSVASGTRVLDWTVPDEWELRSAVLLGPNGERIADASDQPLCVVGHSQPVSGSMSLHELDRHLHSLPDRPDLIPWRTSYYDRGWGFCLPHDVRSNLPDGTYQVEIDADLRPGHLAWGEHIIEGSGPLEVLISAHTCHPALANDNVSGNVVAIATALALADKRPFNSYRFLFAPGTIGAIAWIASNADRLERIQSGLVLSGVGDHGETLHYKRSRMGDSTMDRAMELVMGEKGAAGKVLDFVPWGYDERQYNSPGVDVGVGLLNRTPFGTYPEYHTSADDLSFLSARGLEDAFETVMAAIDVLETNRTWTSTVSMGEPQLGRRGLYDQTGGRLADDERLAYLWVMNLADGSHDLLAMARRSSLPYRTIAVAAQRLADAGLLTPNGD